jgi:hypothetical protein
MQGKIVSDLACMGYMKSAYRILVGERTKLEDRKRLDYVVKTDLEGVEHGRSCLCCENARRMLYFIGIKCLASFQLRYYFKLFNTNENKDKEAVRFKKFLLSFSWSFYHIY